MQDGYGLRLKIQLGESFGLEEVFSNGCPREQLAHCMNHQL